MAGESVTDPNFREVLKDARAEIVGPSAEKEDSDGKELKGNMTIDFYFDLDVLLDPVFATVRGAAEAGGPM